MATVRLIDEMKLHAISIGYRVVAEDSGESGDSLPAETFMLTGPDGMVYTVSVVPL